MKLKPWMRRAIPIALYVVLAVVLYLYLRDVHWGEIAAIQFNWGWLAIGTVVSLLSRYWMVLIWLVLLRSLGAGKFDNIPELALVYAKSWLGRYIPGTAPWILGKIYFASKRGLSKGKLAVSSFLEAGLQIITLLLVGIVMLLIDPRTNVVAGWLRWAMIAALLVGVVALLPPVFNAMARFGYRLIRKKELDRADLPSWPTIIRGTLLYLVGAGFSGLSMFFVALAVDPSLSWDNLAFIIGAANLATAVSMIAIFAPGGVGVRETILITLLGIVMGKALATASSIVLRLWSIVIDFAFFGIAFLHAVIYNRVRKLPPPATVPAGEPVQPGDEDALLIAETETETL
ncbi:MAG: glycosyltransferase 2 family protein [Actinomycetota bacterium]|nr:glycosyltransferase 2 family protein [Actinomycetota bacterium]